MNPNTLTDDDLGRLFRTCYTNAVRQHHPGIPPTTATRPWEQIPPWEQQTATTVATRILTILHTASPAAIEKYSPAERGLILTTTWNTHLRRHHPTAPDRYTTPWADLPIWRQHVNTTIFNTLAQLSTTPPHTYTSTFTGRAPGRFNLNNTHSNLDIAYNIYDPTDIRFTAWDGTEKTLLHLTHTEAQETALRLLIAIGTPHHLIKPLLDHHAQDPNNPLDEHI